MQKNDAQDGVHPDTRIPLLLMNIPPLATEISFALRIFDLEFNARTRGPANQQSDHRTSHCG